MPRISWLRLIFQRWLFILQTLAINSIDSAAKPDYSRARAANKASFFSSGLATAPWAAIMPYVKERLVLDDFFYAVVLLTFGIGAVVGMPVTGCLVKRFGVKPVILTATVLMYLGMLAVSYTDVTLSLVLAGTFIWGAFLGILDIANNVHAARYEELTRSHILSGFQGWYTIGCLAGAGFSPLLLYLGIDTFSIAIILCAFGFVLLWYTVCGLINTHGQRRESAVSQTVLSETKAAGSSAEKSAGNSKKQLKPFGKTAIIRAGIVCFSMYLAEGLIFDWGGVYLIEECGMQISLASIGFVIFEISTALMRFTGDCAVEKIGERRILVFGSILSFVALLAAAFISSWQIVLFCYALLGVALANVVPVMISKTARHCARDKAQAIAMVGTIGYAGVLVGPALLGAMAMTSGLPSIFILGAAFMLLINLAP
ncbi:MAG: MFS transporter [Succinivibrio sp.]|nr:MFS transporter [Succinivibrio sp.]